MESSIASRRLSSRIFCFFRKELSEGSFATSSAVMVKTGSSPPPPAPEATFGIWVSSEAAAGTGPVALVLELLAAFDLAAGFDPVPAFDFAAALVLPALDPAAAFGWSSAVSADFDLAEAVLEAELPVLDVLLSLLGLVIEKRCWGN